MTNPSLQDHIEKILQDRLTVTCQILSTWSDAGNPVFRRLMKDSKPKMSDLEILHSITALTIKHLLEDLKIETDRPWTSLKEIKEVVRESVEREFVEDVLNSLDSEFKSEQTILLELTSKICELDKHNKTS